MPTSLSSASLSELPSSIQRPHYDRSAVRPGIVHIGVGGFFRAHQAVYADDLLASGHDPRWGYCGIGLLASDARMRDALKSQDHLYTLVERNGTANRARIIGSMVDYILAPETPALAIETLASAETKIISLTITEGGYHINQTTGGFDLDHPSVRYDLANPNQPKGIFGYLTASLALRKATHASPVTLMSCDNIQGNGDLLKRHLLAFAGQHNAQLAAWISQNCSFPNSMVDRITPGTSEADRAMVTTEFGFVDQWPVMTETFYQWVLEDHFVAGRPEWEKVGVQFTHDVAAYEKIKLRILNGSHQALTYIGMLRGHTYVHEATLDPGIRKLVELMVQREVIPSLTAMPGMELNAYLGSVLERFANPAIRDPLLRISIYGSSGIPQFLLPSIEDQLKHGDITALSFVIASWFRCLTGVDDNGRAISIADPMAATLREIALRAQHDPATLFTGHDLFGPNLSKSETFKARVTEALQRFHQHGTNATLRHYLDAMTAAS